MALKDWVVEFDGGYIVNVPFVSESRDKIMMKARKILSEQNRYNFEARRASSGRIIKCYPKVIKI